MFCFPVGKNQQISGRETMAEFNFGAQSHGLMWVPCTQLFLQAAFFPSSLLSAPGDYGCASPICQEFINRNELKLQVFPVTAQISATFLNLTKLQRSCTIIFQEQLAQFIQDNLFFISITIQILIFCIAESEIVPFFWGSSSRN